MEPLLPSEIARLVYGYLKKENNVSTAECFLKSSPHLTECYQMYKVNRSFNIKVNGLDLNNIIDIFGTICSMINERISEAFESKTIVEKLQYLLEKNHISSIADKCVMTESNVGVKCINGAIPTEDKSTTNIEADNYSNEVLEIPSFTELISSNVSKTKETDTVGIETNLSVEKNLFTHSSPYLSSTTQLLDENTSTPNFCKNDYKVSPNFQVNEQLCSTPSEIIQETKNIVEPDFHLSPKNINSQLPLDQPECQQIPEATSLDSMPGLSKDDKSKDSSVVIDTGELVDTLLNDQSLLEKIADTINKSIEADDGKISNSPSLEKALDSTQSDPQIKNILDEFLVFNVDNPDDGNKTPDAPNSIKSRLRSAKKKDDVSNKVKKSGSNVTKLNTYGEQTLKVDSNIVLISGTTPMTVNENFDFIPSIVQSKDLMNVGQIYNINTTGVEPEEDYNGRSNYVKIAPKITPMYLNQVAEKPKLIFPKRKKHSLEQFGIRSKFRKTNIASMQPVEPIISSPSIVIEVPNQNSFEVQEKSSTEISNVIKQPEVSKETVALKETISHDTPDDRLKPPKNKSMSTPRRRSTHIRCLDFSTPQPKNNGRDQARSKLFCDTPKRIEKIVEESSPLPKLQADWGSVNGFESIVQKETTKHWDTDIRQMVGAGILTSDADGRKTRKKKTPRKKIKPVNGKNSSELVPEESNTSDVNSIETNEPQNEESNNSNISKNKVGLNEESCDKPFMDDDPNTTMEQSEFLNSLEVSDKKTKLHKEPSAESNSLKCSSPQINQNQSKINITEEEKSINMLKTSTEKITTNVPRTSYSSLNNGNELLNKCDQENLNLSFVDNTVSSKIASDVIPKISDINLEKDSMFLESPFKLLRTSTGENANNSNNDETSKQTNNIKEKKQELSSIELPKSNTSNIKSSIFETPLKLEETKTEIKSTTNSQISSSLLEQNSENKTMKPDYNEQNPMSLSSHDNSKPFSGKHLENKSIEPSEIFQKQVLLDQNKTNISSELNTPMKLDDIPSVKHNLNETPFKCDDAAVDVPETPISKLIREYDPSKLITPLQSTPDHNEDSLSETPLTKVFRETSYLNRPPISPFPPTPGNSRSVDTVIISAEQECINDVNSKICGLKEISIQPIQTNISTECKPLPVTREIKSTQSKTVSKPPTKNRMKNGLNRKSVEAKKKQVYESVKVDLFGSEISSSSSADELENTKEHLKATIISTKPKEKERKSGFKRIPQRKSIQSTPVNGIINHSSNKISAKSNILPFSKPTTVQNENSSLEKAEKTSSIKHSNKSKKSMVHFDDPVEKILNLCSHNTLNKYNYNNTNDKQKNIEINKRCEHLIGLSKLNEKNIKMNQSEDVNSKLNISDSNTNYFVKYNDNKLEKKTPTNSVNILSSKTKTNSTNPRNKSSNNCIVDEIKNSNEKENNKTLNKHNVSLGSTRSDDFVIPDQNVSDKKTNNKSLNKSNRSETSTISYNSSISNTSCITIGYNDELKTQCKKVDDSLNNMEYLKKSKVYEVVMEDGEREMVSLSLSAPFTLLNIPSKLNRMQSDNPTISPSKENKSLDSTPKLEAGELEDDEIIMPGTSTPKDAVEKQRNKEESRSRRSPSFWEDSSHNYPNKHRDDRCRESKWQNKDHRGHKYDQKYWPNRSRYHDKRSQFNIRNPHQRNHHVNVKREYFDDQIRDKERFRFKEDRRRSYRDEPKGRDRLDELERFSSSSRISHNDPPKLNRPEETIKKATKRPADRTDHHKTPAKVSKVEHQRLLKNVNVDDFLSVVHGQK